MKRCLLLFCVAIIVAYASCNAQESRIDTPAQRTIKIGSVYWAIDSGKVNSIYEVWDNQCPPPKTVLIVDSIDRPVYIHDTMWQNGLVWQPVKPAAIPISIFTTQTTPTVNQNDGKGLTVGIKFRTSTAGYIRGVRFYKVAGNTAQHTGELYNAAGTKLATGVYSGESVSGWQTLLFSTPVPIALNTVYVATVFNPAGYYAGTVNGFVSSIQNQSLTGLADGVSGANGVYDYGSGPVFPKSSFSKTNYWVDVIFTTSL